MWLAAWTAFVLAQDTPLPDTSVDPASLTLDADFIVGHNFDREFAEFGTQLSGMYGITDTIGAVASFGYLVDIDEDVELNQYTITGDVIFQVVERGVPISLFAGAGFQSSEFEEGPIDEKDDNGLVEGGIQFKVPEKGPVSAQLLLQVQFQFGDDDDALFIGGLEIGAEVSRAVELTAGVVGLIDEDSTALWFLFGLNASW